MWYFYCFIFFHTCNLRKIVSNLPSGNDNKARIIKSKFIFVKTHQTKLIYLKMILFSEVYQQKIKITPYEIKVSAIHLTPKIRIQPNF
ncbi:hypothetical protein EHQ11_05660 [Leptospira kanakyensis]|nr:hypothetical protein EHQ11_05660 [Leptospira kanakyensis]